MLEITEGQVVDGKYDDPSYLIVMSSISVFEDHHGWQTGLPVSGYQQGLSEEKKNKATYGVVNLRDLGHPLYVPFVTPLILVGIRLKKNQATMETRSRDLACDIAG